MEVFIRQPEFQRTYLPLLAALMLRHAGGKRQFCDFYTRFAHVLMFRSGIRRPTLLEGFTACAESSARRISMMYLAQGRQSLRTISSSTVCKDASGFPPRLLATPQSELRFSIFAHHVCGEIFSGYATPRADKNVFVRAVRSRSMIGCGNRLRFARKMWTQA